MRLLIDGYNLLFQSIVIERGLQGNNALRAARGRLMELLFELIDDSERVGTMIVFDAKEAPPGLPDRYLHHGIQIVFARDWDSADELIQLEIRKHPTPKRLTVVSSDHAIHKKAIARGAKVLDSDEWLDEQFDRQRRQREAKDDAAANPDPDIKQRELSDEEKRKWLQDFGF
ncbi:MAG: NYN domain-containing protein [Pirellula staleyi]